MHLKNIVGSFGTDDGAKKVAGIAVMKFGDVNGSGLMLDGVRKAGCFRGRDDRGRRCNPFAGCLPFGASGARQTDVVTMP
jgi:hypothetical protein